MPNDESEGLRDDALVIRFGLMELQHVWNSLNTAMDNPDIERWELSFFGGNDLSAEEIARIARRPNPRMRRSTAGLLRSGGFDPYPDDPPPAHLGLNFDQKPTDEELMRLISLFDLPEENPHAF